MPWRAPDAGEAVVSPRAVTTVVAGALTFVLALAMLLVDPPYVVNSPGPTIDTLGDVEGEPVITIAGEETYPAQGELRLTTVSTVGGPGFPVNAAQVLRGWAAGTRTVMPREAVFDPDETREEVQHVSSVEMTSSQSSASVAALQELDYQVPTELWVAGASPHGPAAGVLEEGDRLEWLEVAGERTEITDFAALTAVLGSTPPASPITLGVRRDGEAVALELETTGDDDGGSLLGVYLSSEADLPVDVSFIIDNIGGPSAGTMLALAIVDRLTPGSLAGEEVVAGTGTMSLDGEVGPIGGIRQKLAGARRDGAQWFLAPADNCAETEGYVPDGLHVVRIDTLHDAREAVEAIGTGQVEDLPSCTLG